MNRIVGATPALLMIWSLEACFLVTRSSSAQMPDERVPTETKGQIERLGGSLTHYVDPATGRRMVYFIMAPTTSDKDLTKLPQALL